MASLVNSHKWYAYDVQYWSYSRNQNEAVYSIMSSRK